MTAASYSLFGNAYLDMYFTLEHQTKYNTDKLSFFTKNLININSVKTSKTVIFICLEIYQNISVICLFTTLK